MSDFSIYEDNTGLYIGKQKYVGDIDFEGVMEGKRYTTKIKHYGNAYQKRLFCNKAIFGASIPKKQKNKSSDVGSIDDTDDLPDENKKIERDRHKEVIRKMAETVHDIILLNPDLEYFFTLTIDPQKIDSTDPKAVGQKVNDWLRNQTKRKGLKYILLPEYHPEKGDHKIHFHGLINNVFKLVDSGTRTVKGFSHPLKLETIEHLKIPDSQIKSIVYNVPEWKHGFTTAIPVYGTRLAIARYVTKYVTKDDCKDNCKIFGKYYWSSRSCNRKPDIEIRDDGGAYFDDSEAKPYFICGGIAIKYENLDGDIPDADIDQFLEMNPEFGDRLSVKNFFKESSLMKSADKVEEHKRMEREFEAYLREREKRQKAEREELQRLRDLQAAERRARREWRDRQLKLTITKGGAIDSIRASKKLRD